MITDFLYCRPEQYTLKEVHVFRHHCDHINIPTFRKTLYCGIQFCSSKGMKAMLDIV
jgi:hypothetical protein